jgi:hypothetical protein
MHVSILLAGASIAILAFSGTSENPVSQIYGVVMLPVAIAFIVYSMYQCEWFWLGWGWVVERRRTNQRWDAIFVVDVLFMFLNCFLAPKNRRSTGLHDSKSAPWTL